MSLFPFQAVNKFRAFEGTHNCFSEEFRGEILKIAQVCERIDRVHLNAWEKTRSTFEAIPSPTTRNPLSAHSITPNLYTSESVYSMVYATELFPPPGFPSSDPEKGQKTIQSISRKFVKLARQFFRELRC